MRALLNSFMNDESGQGLVEYALIIVLISIVSIVIMTTLGTSITSVFSKANGSLVPQAAP